MLRFPQILPHLAPEKRYNLRYSVWVPGSKLSISNITRISQRYPAPNDIDMLRGVSATDIAFVNLMLHRRHIIEHNASVADERYVRESGDENAEVGLLIREDRDNVHRFIGVLARMAGNLDYGFREIFPPTEKFVTDYEETKRRIIANEIC